MEKVSVEYGDVVEVSEEIIAGVPSPNLPGGTSPFTVSHLTQGLYNEYLIDTQTITETGLDVAPTSVPDGEGVVYRVHCGVTEKLVHWTVEGLNAMPLLPALTTSDQNEVPIRQELLLCNVLPTENGGQVWRASGINRYKLRKAKVSSSRYPVSSSAAEVAPSSQRSYGPEHFSTAIIDASFASPGGVPLATVIRVGS